MYHFSADLVLTQMFTPFGLSIVENAYVPEGGNKRGWGATFFPETENLNFGDF